MATEKRLIDANEVEDAFTKWLTRTYDGRMPRDIVAEIPTVDAVEVVHGRWETIAVSDELYQCSACGEWLFIPEEDFAYCPNCGAKMDGGAGIGG